MQALANHPGIGVLIVRSADHGADRVGKDGIHYLDEERIEGEDPLAVYGEHAVAAVQRLDAIEHVGDIAVDQSRSTPRRRRSPRSRSSSAPTAAWEARRRVPSCSIPSDWELDLAPLMGAPDGLPAAAPLDGARAGDALREG